VKKLPKVMVAPNGARLGKADHPALPITDEEIIVCARDCFAAGAGGIHAHIRDGEGQHLLDSGRYGELVRALKAEVPVMDIQITTEAVGRHVPPHQMQVALNSGADMVSVSIREICRDGSEGAAQFFERCRQAEISVQHIIYDQSDFHLLGSTLSVDRLHASDLQLLFVLGSYADQRDAKPEDLDPFLDWQRSHDIEPDWAICAFGVNELRCLQYADAEGGKCRIGFENSRFLGDGSIARDNAEKVAELMRCIGEKS